MPRTLIIVVAGFVVFASGCAPIEQSQSAGDARPGPCFVGSQLSNFRVEDERTVYVRSRQGDVYRLDTPPGCFDAGTVTVRISSRDRPSNRICIGDQARVEVGRNASTPLACIARVSGPITDSSVSGLPARR